MGRKSFDQYIFRKSILTKNKWLTAPYSNHHTGKSQYLALFNTSTPPVISKIIPRRCVENAEHAKMRR